MSSASVDLASTTAVNWDHSFECFYILRDYSSTTGIKFQTIYPEIFEGQISKEEFQSMIEGINRLFAEAEKFTTSTYIKGWISCLTGYLIDLCLPNPYDKMLKKLDRYIEDQNLSVFHSRGLHLHNPMEKSLRLIEISSLRRT